MSLLVLEDLKKHFGAQEVLAGTSLTVEVGDKVGIVGRNGGGKSTLFHIITGEESPDWGSAHLRKGARLGFVPQRPEFPPGTSLRAYVEAGLSEARAIIARLEETGERMAEAEDVQLDRLMREHDRLHHELEVLGGWDTERRAETVLSGIGLGPELWERDARTLSGGEKNRAAIARELVSGHDLLLLDEPTNHLDVEGIEWIERYLRELQGAVIIVSHDRRLLANAVDTILELEHGRLTAYPGNYPRYLTLKAERHASLLRAWEQQQELLRKEDLFIKRHMGTQRTAEAKGRAKKLSNLVRLERPHHDVRRPVIRPPEAARGGELVLSTEGLSGGYGSKVLFTGVNLRVGRGQRIGVVGPNGSGKTTLLKILAGRMQPLAGEVTYGHGAVGAYYDQDTSHLRQDGTPFSELKLHEPKLTDLELRSHLARFLFRGSEVDKPVPALSGGERARLSLAVLVRSKPSWMALDEPTNHLDLASRTALEEMLSEFQGALLCVSHDREFLDGLCDHVIEVAGGEVREHAGNYTSWRAAREAELAAASQARARAAAEQKRAARAAAEKRAGRAARKASKQGTEKATGKKASSGTSRSRGGRSQSGGSKPRNPFLFDKLEKRIIQLEETLAKLVTECGREEVYLAPDRLRETQFRIAEVERELESANEQWANWE